MCQGFALSIIDIPYTNMSEAEVPTKIACLVPSAGIPRAARVEAAVRGRPIAPLPGQFPAAALVPSARTMPRKITAWAG